MIKIRDIKTIAIALLSLFVLACSDIVNYGGGGGADKEAKISVLEYLQSKPEHSKFLELLNETGLIETLSGDYLVTIFAPLNDEFPDDVDQMAPAVKKLMINNHICLTLLYSSSLERMERVRTLASKFLDISFDPTGLQVDGVELVQTNILCSDGVVHCPSQWLAPRLNLQQWLENLSDDYSIFRDSLLAYNVLEFDKENSKLLGVDENGSIYYDSIWVVNNLLLNDADLSDENLRYTLFAPDNQAFKDMYTYQTNFLEGVNYPVATEDTVAWAHWVMKAAMHLEVRDWEPEQAFLSVHDLELRTDYNEVEKRVNMSNGVAYQMSKCYVPRNLYAKAVSFNPYWIRAMLSTSTSPIIALPQTTAYDGWEPNVNQTTSKFYETKGVFWQFNTPGVTTNSYWFSSCEYELDEESGISTLTPLNIFPGNYTMRICLFKYEGSNSTNVLNVYNVVAGTDLLIAQAIGITGSEAFGGGGGQLIKTYPFNRKLVSGEYQDAEYQPITIKLRIPQAENDANKRKICVGEVTLIPTEDNY